MNGWLVVPALMVGAPAAYFAGRAIYDDWYERWRVWQDDKIEIGRRCQRAAIDNVRHLEADVNGRGGWTIYPDGRIVNLDTRAVFDQNAVYHLEPILERMDHFERALLAMRGTHSGNSELLEMPELSFQWPMHYAFDAMAKRHLKRPSYHNILLGVTYDETGNETPVLGDMEDMIHLMIGGRSGFGKSNLEFSIADQLRQSVDPCKLALIDYAGTTLAPLEKSSNVLWPMATDDGGALGIFRELVRELERRKALFMDCPGVQKLSQYNALDRESLEPWYVFVDETPQLVKNGELCELFTIIAEQARKFGLGIVAAGTTWHAKIVPEPLRVNFATRTAVYCSRTTSRVVLDGEPDAHDLERPGLACLMFPGRTGIQQMLTPEVEFEVVDGDGPVWAMPDVSSNEELLFTDTAILDVWNKLPAQGKKQNKSNVCKALGGQPVGGFFYKVDTAGKQLGIWD